MARILLPPAAIVGDLATVTGPAFHHLARVLRLGVGASLQLFDGQGHRWPATIRELGTERAVLALGPPEEAPPAPELTLAQGLAKGDKLELVVQKATELGVSRVVPLALARSVVKLTPEKGEERAGRWRKIAEEAARQCGRADVPAVESPVTLPSFLAAAQFRGEAVALLHEGETTRLSVWARAQAGRPLAIVVGPEGGLAPQELALAVAAGAAVVGLGPRVLRTETAGLAALAVLLHVAGELG